MVTNRSVPVNTLLPHLSYQNVDEAIRWLTRVFGFTEHYRYGEPNGIVNGAQLFLGNAYIMVRSARDHATPAQLGYGTQSLTVFVDDVDAHFARVKAGGARLVEELHETVYGEQQYGVEDLEGHRWLFSQHSRDVNPEDWGAVIFKPRME
jgi:uncharacterized glyoxalase superfamily protein PhnB